MQNLSEDTKRELEVKSAAQSLIGELSSSLLAGVPRPLFDALHQSFSKLNLKLASGVEINNTAEHHELGHPLIFDDMPQSNPLVFDLPQSFDHSDSDKDLHDALEPAEGPDVGTIDRCCYCLTHASKEELMMTPCCHNSVGSICFEEWREETGKCCLCQAYQLRSGSPYLATISEDTNDYKYHFDTESLQDETNTKADVEIARTSFCEQGSSSAVADVSSTLPNASEALRASTIVNKKTAVLDTSDLSVDIETMRMADDKRRLSYYNTPVSLQSRKNFSRNFKLRTVVPEDPTAMLSQSAADQQSCEPVEKAQYEPPNPSALAITTVSAPTKLQVSLSPTKQYPQTKEGDDHHATKSHRLTLIDHDVIRHLKGARDVRGSDLLDLVHSALIGRLRRTVCRQFFHQAKFLPNGNIDVSICLRCSQESDSMHGMKDWPRAFESFVLTTQLQSYKVTVDHIQIGSMKILILFEKSRTVQKLVRDNIPVLKSLTNSADIRGVCWNKNIIGLNPNESTSITITFRTAQQANEAIEHGIFWHHERRLCRRQGPHPRITQCGQCQAYGHVFEDCSSTPRCRVCAGIHLSEACVHDPTANKACLKCALCSGPHEATNDNCNSRKEERNRLQLENRFYATGAAKVEQGGTASAA